MLLARHLPHLSKLWAAKNKLSWEGVATLANNLTEMNLLNIEENSQVIQGSSWLGKLASLTVVSIGTCEVMQPKPDVQVGL